MIARLVQVGPSPADVSLRTQCNWPAAATAATLSLLHLGVAWLHREQSPWAATAALVLGVLFGFVTLAMLLCYREVELNVSRRCVCLRMGLGRLTAERRIPFAQIQAVRLTQLDRYGRHRSRIELLCEGENLRCPLTHAPRQQALLMAMAINARLIKIWQSTTPTAPSERIHQLFGSKGDSRN